MKEANQYGKPGNPTVDSVDGKTNLKQEKDTIMDRFNKEGC